MNEGGLWYNDFFSCLWSQEVRLHPAAHGTINLSLGGSGSKKYIFHFAQRNGDSSLQSSPTSHIGLEPKSSGPPPRTLSTRMFCCRIAPLYVSLHSEHADPNPLLQTLKEIKLGSCPKFYDIMS